MITQEEVCGILPSLVKCVAKYTRDSARINISDMASAYASPSFGEVPRPSSSMMTRLSFVAYLEITLVVGQAEKGPSREENHCGV
jgi:hypothetical protein